ncbi:MAG TPA: MraY family glycosyltransferase [Bacteroidales bacterium]|nr:MraY family glycosyltransferase [Bacteroidales bacterium]
MLQLSLNELPLVIMAFIISGLFTFISLHKIIKVDSKRHLTDSPGPRKVHHREIPTLGGVGIFGGFTFGFLLAVDGAMNGVSYFTAAAGLLFFIGIVDDLININPLKKLYVEIFAALILFTFTDMRFTDFHGFLGITTIPNWLSFITTIFLVVGIINSLNLIDGIDGLAASIGIIASAVLGIWFWLSEDYGYAIMASALLGALVVFLRFNLTDGPKKIFMGDTGSLIIGFILAVMIIRFNEINAGPSTFHDLESVPAVSIAILIVPLFDTLRVFVLRLKHGRSPFRADNRHVHHILLRAGCTHRQATLYLSLTNIIIIAIAFLLDHIGILWLSLVLLLICIGLTELVYLQVRRNVGRRRLFHLTPHHYF